MSHGLKSLARELPKHGRYGDSIVAHINPEEAALLKALGGSGTINPTTGLPEFFSLGSVFKPIQQAIGQANPFNPGSAAGKAIASVPGVSQLQNAATQVFQPVEKAVVQPASAGLAQFDKAVGKAVPGGWGTVGMVAASMIPGMQPLGMAALGAINGSGVLRKGGSFNLQGAMMGGAMAYGMSSLAQYAQGAVPTSGVENAPVTLPGAEGTSVLPGELGDIPVSTSAPTPQAPNPQPMINYSAAPGTGGYSEAIASGAAPSGVPTNVVTPSLSEIDAIRATQPGLFEQAGNYVANIPNAVGQAVQSAGTSASNAYDALSNPETYKQFGSDYMSNVSKTGEGIKNLVGLGDTTASAASKLASASTGINPTMAAAGTIYGGMGLAALEEQRNMLEQQKAANAITQAEYDNAMAEISRSEADARRVVSEHPFSTTPSRDVSIGDTYYGRTGSEDNLYARNTAPESRMYAMGGSVDDESGMDEAKGLAPGNMQNGFMGGGITGGNLALRELSQPAFSQGAVGGTQSFAEGGIARFLSGGGDGMSDDIPARINGKQEARLADGEFVIPADVVSHLGNGSSKAGAKQLYSMMDKVRSARTGTKKQGKQINPRKFLAA